MRTLFSSLHLSLEIFEGPLDVFVHLAQKKEVKYQEVQLGSLFNFLNPYSLDLEMASHFIEQFSFLMLFKSRDCLPFEEKDKEDQLAPPEEAIAHLADYYQFKQVAFALDARQNEESNRFIRGAKEDAHIPLPPVGIEQISLDDLQRVFQNLLDKLPQERIIESDPWSIGDGKRRIEEALARGNFELIEFLSEVESRALLIVTFLAILELMKEGTILVGEDLKVEKVEL